MSRVLVTGGTGFIGSHLVERLTNDGRSVKCLVRDKARAKSLEERGVALIEGDVRRPESLAGAVKGVDVVYHLAGSTMVRSPIEYQRVNDQGTHNMGAACAAASNPPLLIYVSSLAAGHATRESDAAVETDPSSPVSAYGRSKLAGEQKLAQFASQMPMTVLRPPIVFGPRERYLLPLFKLAKRGWMVLPGRPWQYSLLHVRELVEAMLVAAERGERVEMGDESGEKRGFYYVAHQEQPTFQELGNLIAAALQRPPVRTLCLPLALCWLAAGCSQVLGSLLRRGSVVNLDKIREAQAGSWICNVERARSELRFSPQKPLSQRIHETTQWYLDTGWL